MKIIITKDYDELSKKAANIIAAQVLIKPDAVLGLATGSSPVGTYKKLIEYYKDGGVSFKDVKAVNLDEYLGLDKTNNQSYYYFMHENFFNYIDIQETNTNIPNGVAADIDAECLRYDKVIETLGGIDLQLLGVGTNGHIAFNEPSEEISNGTYCVNLTQSTIEANKRFFTNEKDVPKRAFTMGVGSILRSKKAVMVVSGSNKADILEKTIFGPITPLVPASLMQLHPDFTIIADIEAAAIIKDRI